MLKFSDLLYTFIKKLYVFLIIFVLIFGVGSIKNAIEYKLLLASEGTYASQSEIYVSSQNPAINSDALTNHMNNIVTRVKTPIFIDLVKEEIDKGIVAGGEFVEFTSENKDILKNLTIVEVKNNINIEVEPTTHVFNISYSNDVPIVAQAVNKIITNQINSILNSGDKDNILGVANNNLSLRCIIGKDASLPTSLSLPNGQTKASLSLMKVVIISGLLYILIVIVYDFVIGYITSYQKAKNMVHAEIISEIQIPYEKNQNKSISNDEISCDACKNNGEGK